MKDFLQILISFRLKVKRKLLLRGNRQNIHQSLLIYPLPQWISLSDNLSPKKEILDDIEFARGDSKSKWGSVRAGLGHPEPFDLKYIAMGNKDYGKKHYRGNYLKFHAVIKCAYPNIKIISNCDGSSQPLVHPADFYDYHIYSSANNVFASSQKFDRASRNGPKAFVSEYAVTGNDAGKGSLFAALDEVGFLIGLERNCSEEFLD